MAEIRLTWWREVLDEIFSHGPVRRHPAAQALGGAVRRASLPRAPLEAMIDGRIAALDQQTLNAEEAVGWADAVQGSAAALAVSILDPAAPAEAALAAGRAWGLALLRRSGRALPSQVDEPLRLALTHARTDAGRLGVAAFPAVLAARLARYDLAGRTPGPLTRRLSLVVAAATGWI
jgi:phytoene synthase